MSAFIVSDTHIDALVTYAMENQIQYFHGDEWHAINAHTADAVGRILMDENVRSVGHRYDGRIDEDEKNAGATYSFKRFATPLTAVEAIKGCHCLDYQSCETDDWKDSVAYSILQAIESHATHHVPGYDAAPWGIDSDKGLKHAGTVSLMSLTAKRKG